MRLLAASATLVLALLACGARAEPKFPPPPGSRVSLVGDRMNFNGMPMKVRQFVSRYGVERVLEYYRHLWSGQTADGLPGLVESDALPPWTILTRMQDDYVLTVQVAPEGSGSAGYLALSRLPEQADTGELGGDFPAMQGSTFYNDIESEDRGQSGRTVQLSNLFNVRGNVAFYRNYFRDRGWSELVDRAMNEDLHTLTFRDGNETVTVVIMRAETGDTLVTVQTIEQGW